MKRFSKLLALGVAAALTFGMTVSAAPSPNAPTEDQKATAAIVNAIVQTAGVQNSKGETVNVEVNVDTLDGGAYNEAFGENYEDALSKAAGNDAVYAAMQEAAGVFTENQVWYDDYIINVNVEGVIPEGGLYVPVAAIKEGDACVVAHWNEETKTWEVLQTKIENGYVYALFQDFSPVYYAVLYVTGEENPGTDPGTNPGTNPPGDNGGNTAPSSPKTGETVPMAGILAVVCLAGVAVCAKKVRYNR